jgi:uncharacterized damage-inducible protein DinB
MDRCRKPLWPLLIPALALALAAWPAAAAAEEAAAGAEATAAPDLRADLLWSLDDARDKLVALAQAIPAEKYGWRPSEEVRTVSEVFMHVAGANYFLPRLAGVAPPEGVSRDMEKETDKAKVVAALEQSFAHAHQAIAELPEADFDKAVSFGGHPSTVRRVLLLVVTHGHEHLGQAIAYARSIGVVPPWSAGGGS